MFEEAAVLGRNKGIDDMLRQIVIVDENPAPFADFLDQPPVPAVNSKRDLQRYLADGLRLRQARFDVKVGADDRCGDSNRR